MMIIYSSAARHINARHLPLDRDLEIFLDHSLLARLLMGATQLP